LVPSAKEGILLFFLKSVTSFIETVQAIDAY